MTLKNRIENLERECAKTMTPATYSTQRADFLQDIIKNINEGKCERGPLKDPGPLPPDAGPTGRFIHEILVRHYQEQQSGLDLPDC